MSDAPATGTSSTPAADSPAEPVAAAPAADAKPAEATPALAAPEGPLFTIPEDVKLPKEALTKFEAFFKKGNHTPQELVDHYIEQARDANTAWEKQIKEVNASNEAACKTRFSGEQLKAAEKAVGFATSLDPGFKEFAKRQLNDPVFVNFMREIGERLSEDTFEDATRPPPQPRSRAERMGYTKPKAN